MMAMRKLPYAVLKKRKRTAAENLPKNGKKVAGKAGGTSARGHHEWMHGCVVMRSGDFSWQIASSASVPRLDGAFGNVDVAIDHLKVRQTPISEQLGPRRFPIFAPHAI